MSERHDNSNQEELNTELQKWDKARNFAVGLFLIAATSAVTAYSMGIELDGETARGHLGLVVALALFTMAGSALRFGVCVYNSRKVIKDAEEYGLKVSRVGLFKRKIAA